MPNSNLLQLTRTTRPTNITTTGLIKHIVVIVGITAEGIININHKATIEVLIEVHSKVITRKNPTFIRN